MIGFWPSLAVFAADIGVEYGHAKRQKARNSIPDAYRPAVVAAARRRKIPGVTFKTLTISAARFRAKGKRK